MEKNFRIYPCNRPNCIYTRETCRSAHSVSEWVVPDSLKCDFRNDCRKVACRRVHDESMEQKMAVVAYKKIVFKDRPLVVRAVPVVIPIAEVERVDKVTYLMNKKQALQEEYLRALTIMLEVEDKIRRFKNEASDTWEAGSAELNF